MSHFCIIWEVQSFLVQAEVRRRNLSSEALVEKGKEENSSVQKHFETMTFKKWIHKLIFMEFYSFN